MPRRLLTLILGLSLSLVVAPAAPGQPGGAKKKKPATAEAAEPKAKTEEKPSEPLPKSDGTVENSVVKIFATARYPEPYKPWTKDSPRDATGSGVVIAGNRILTNAHVVSYSSQVQVQAHQSGDKLSATVEFIAPGIDLAILKLDDESFFKKHRPLQPASKLPDIKDTVLAYGSPEGGSNLSITKGIVSRVEFTGYNYSVSGLRIQIDAAINPGNSGGPVVVDNKMIGLVFSHLRDSDKIGYIIPMEEISLFLADIADGRYDGKPIMLDEMQTLENPALRAYLKLPAEAEGLVVRRPYDHGPATVLKPWDVICKIGDIAVDNQGMIKFDENVRIRFGYQLQKLVSEGTVPLTVWRDGAQVAVKHPVVTERPLLIPNLLGTYPSYFVLGPLVFSEATGHYVNGFTRPNNERNHLAGLVYDSNPLATRIFDSPAYPGERLVIISSPFFPHRLSKGYGNPFAQTVKSINGTAVKNLGHLVGLLRDSKDEFVVIDFAQRGAETVVFRRAELLKETDDILTDNGVRSQGSADMLEIWNAKGSSK
ncbi:MAG: trypsin-like peptidase domain-containing protein [Verrucomicrobia bacterium]|nr:trypsin-like peptidase domain-containing protein [Verrucomicrobiota bacterium]